VDECWLHPAPPGVRDEEEEEEEEKKTSAERHTITTSNARFKIVRWNLFVRALPASCFSLRQPEACNRNVAGARRSRRFTAQTSASVEYKTTPFSSDAEAA